MSFVEMEIAKQPHFLKIADSLHEWHICLYFPCVWSISDAVKEPQKGIYSPHK